MRTGGRSRTESYVHWKQQRVRSWFAYPLQFTDELNLDCRHRNMLYVRLLFREFSVSTFGVGLGFNRQSARLSRVTENDLPFVICHLAQKLCI